ncbi:MAG: efflux RND transporter periplasmic adaptor subunit [Alphaproteobacteria bacterium]|nr:efflux RND transporter periplasmic adaptor subunit [Alphaproteobacteria bacterium]
MLLKNMILLVTAFMMSATTSLAQQGQGAGGPPPAPVRVDVAVETDMAPTIQSPATVLSRSDSRIASEGVGRVVYVAEPGDLVSEGEAVARLDDAEPRLQLGEAQARLARLSANADYQNAEYERWSRLADAGTAPQTRLREAELARNLAVQEVAEARSAVQRARLTLERMEILAPFDGRVVERLIEVGEYSNPGREIVRLVNTSALEARAQAPIAVAAYIQTGDAVTVSDGERDIEAPVRRIIPVGDEATRTFEVRVDLADSPWIAGTAVRVHLPRAPAEHVIAVPQDAVVLRSSGAHVWVVEDGDTVRQVRVTTGTRGDGLTAVAGDLEAGDRVVVRGAENLQPGQAVTILTDAVSANAGGNTGGNIAN